MKQDHPLRIALSINENYVGPCCVCLTSILAHHPDTPMDIYIMHAGLTPASQSRLDHLSWLYRACTIHLLTMDEDRFKNFNTHIAHTSRETWFRYVLPDLLPDIDKILYLDVDIIVNSPLDGLWATDLSNMYAAGVDDLQIRREGYRQFIGFDDRDTYVNAGVLLLNLDTLRREGKVSDLFKITEERGSSLKYQDQDAINIVFKGKILSLDSRYNFTSANVRREKDKRRNACIVHFTGERKPWLPRCRNHFRHAWKRYEKQYLKLQHRKLNVGLLIDEFFGGANTAYGGYGFLARHFIAKYIPNEHICVDVLLGRGKRYLSTRKDTVDGTHLYRLPKLGYMVRRFLRKKNYDVYLSIELTTDYVLKHETDTRKKLVLWIQDPRPKSAWDHTIGTMQSIKDPCFYNQTIYDFVHQLNKEHRVTFASQGESLNPLARELYNLPDDIPITNLPNPVDFDPEYTWSLAQKKKQVIFLGRLEAQKRAWLFCEVAKRLPEYEFYVLGQFYRYRTDNERMLRSYLNHKPGNLHFAGHADGDMKERYLKESRILLNTSIWEGIPISWLEALASGTSLVSNLDRDRLVDRFGLCVGEIPGDGYEEVERFIPAIRNLMENDALYEEKARAAIAYIRSHHDSKKIVSMLRRLLRENATSHS